MKLIRLFQLAFCRHALITADAISHSTYFDLNVNFRNIEIALTALRQDSALLLPRPYPGFMPLYYGSKQAVVFNLKNTEKLEITIGSELSSVEWNKPYSMEIESVWLEKN